MIQMKWYPASRLVAPNSPIQNRSVWHSMLSLCNKTESFQSDIYWKGVKNWISYSYIDFNSLLNFIRSFDVSFLLLLFGVLSHFTNPKHNEIRPIVLVKNGFGAYQTKMVQLFSCCCLFVEKLIIIFLSSSAKEAFFIDSFIFHER